jgi:hypothetical protein
MSQIELGLIVEGEGEVEAAPVLIRRLALAIDPSLSLRFERRRIPRSQLIRPGEIERAIGALLRQIGRQQPVLILLDADDDCPKDLADKLKAQCRAAHGDASVSIVVAKREYEAWFLAAADSLAACGRLAAQTTAPSDPESIRGAKEWLRDRMGAGNTYSPTRHQPAFSELMELSEAMRARSSRKLEKEVRRLLQPHLRS